MPHDDTMTMTQFSPARPAWPLTLGRAVRDATAAVALGVVIGLAYARVSTWSTDRAQDALAERPITASGTAADVRVRARTHDRAAPGRQETDCPSPLTVALAAAALPMCRQRAE